MLDIKQTRLSMSRDVNLGSSSGRKSSVRHTDLTLTRHVDPKEYEHVSHHDGGEFSRMLRRESTHANVSSHDTRDKGKTEHVHSDSKDVQQSTQDGVQKTQDDKHDEHRGSVRVAKKVHDPKEIASADSKRPSRHQDAKLVNVLISIFSFLSHKNSPQRGMASQNHLAIDALNTLKKSNPKLASLVSTLAKDIEKTLSNGKSASLPQGSEIAQWLEKSGASKDMTADLSKFMAAKNPQDRKKALNALTHEFTQILSQTHPAKNEALTAFGLSSENALPGEDVNHHFVQHKDKKTSSSHVHVSPSLMSGKDTKTHKLTAQQQKAAQRLSQFKASGRVTHISVSDSERASSGYMATTSSESKSAKDKQGIGNKNAEKTDLSGHEKDSLGPGRIEQPSGRGAILQHQNTRSGFKHSQEKTLEHALKNSTDTNNSLEGKKEGAQTSFAATIEEKNNNFSAKKTQATAQRPVHEIVHEVIDFYSMSGMRNSGQTLRMTVMSVDSKPVGVELANAHNGSINVVLQPSDAEMMHRLSGTKQDLLTALGAAEIKMDDIHIKVAPVENSASSQNAGGDLLSQSGGDLGGGFMQQNNQQFSMSGNVSSQYPNVADNGDDSVVATKESQVTAHRVQRNGKYGVNITA